MTESPRRPKWEPIATAPRDGSIILVFCNHPYGSVRVAFWQTRAEYEWKKIDADTQKRVQTGETSDWYCTQLGWDSSYELNDEDEGVGFNPPYVPTHWLSLPPGPISFSYGNTEPPQFDEGDA